MESEYVICPYDKSHKILRFRMPGHLIKCKKNYRGEPLQACPFNATHLVIPTEMQKHIEDCKDYYKAHAEKYERYFEQNVVKD